MMLANFSGLCFGYIIALAFFLLALVSKRYRLRVFLCAAAWLSVIAWSVLLNMVVGLGGIVPTQSAAMREAHSTFQGAAAAAMLVAFIGSLAFTASFI